MMKKRKLKKYISILLAVVLLFALFGCGKKQEPEPVPDPPEEEQGDGSPTVTLSLNQLLDIANREWTFNAMVSKIFSDYIAYTEDGIIKVGERKKDVPENKIDFSKIVTDDKGFKYYDLSNPTKQSWKGIDVSKHQGDIDWAAVANMGVDFAIIRLGYRGYSEGAFVKDEYFDHNVQQALDQGIGVGVYFVTQAISVEEAKEEAQYVLDSISGYNITWPIALDVEETSSPDARTSRLTVEKRSEQIAAFCKEIEDAGYSPIVYSNTKWFVTKIDMSVIKDYDIWYSYYPSEKNYNYDCGYLPYEYTIWQYSCRGRVNGIDGDVDLNISFKNYGQQ